MQRSAVYVRNKPQRLANDFPVLRVKVLEQIIFGAKDDKGDGERVEQVFVWVVLPYPAPGLRVVDVIVVERMSMWKHAACTSSYIPTHPEWQWRGGGEECKVPPTPHYQREHVQV